MKESKSERDDRVTVAVRLDASSENVSESDVCVYANLDNQAIHFNAPHQMLDIPGKASFRFDKVFDDEDDEVSVYEECVEPLVEYTIRGHNATVLCYGDTESNAEHSPSLVHDTSVQNSLQSSSSLLFRALIDLISYKESIANKSLVQLTLSVIELHVDEIVDLLGSERKTVEYSFTSEEMTLQGITVVEVNTIDDVSQHLEEIKLLRMNETDVKNKTSACSHVLFFVDVLQSPVDSNENSAESTALPVPSLHDINREVPDSNSAITNTRTTKHSRFVFVDLASSMFVEQAHAITFNAAEVESVNSTFSVLSRAITAMNTRSKHNPYRKCMLTKLLRHTFTDRHSRVLLMGQITPNVDNALSTLRTLSFCNNIKKLSVTNDQDAEEQSVILQSYLEAQRTNEELMAEMHILKQEHSFTPTKVHVLSQVRKEPIDLVRQRIAEKLKVNLPTMKIKREAEETRELELQAARERDEEVEQFVLYMNSLIEEYERVVKSIKSEKKKLKKQKLESEKGNDNTSKINDGSNNNNENNNNNDDDIGNDNEREKMLIHEAKKAKKTRLKLETEVKRLKEELEAQQITDGNDDVTSANANLTNEKANVKQYYDEDIDSETNNDINIYKNVLAVQPTAIATHNKSCNDASIPSSSDADTSNWKEAVHSLVSSFVESATEVNKLHVQYILRLLTSLRLRLRVKQLRISSSDIMTEGTLLSDVIDFIITRAVHVAEKVIQPNSP